VDVDECSSRPCQNGGTCLESSLVVGTCRNTSGGAVASFVPSSQDAAEEINCTATGHSWTANTWSPNTWVPAVAAACLDPATGAVVASVTNQRDCELRQDSAGAARVWQGGQCRCTPQGSTSGGVSFDSAHGNSGGCQAFYAQYASALPGFSRDDCISLRCVHTGACTGQDHGIDILWEPATCSGEALPADVSILWYAQRNRAPNQAHNDSCQRTGYSWRDFTSPVCRNPATAAVTATDVADCQNGGTCSTRGATLSLTSTIRGCYAVGDAYDAYDMLSPSGQAHTMTKGDYCALRGQHRTGNVVIDLEACEGAPQFGGSRQFSSVCVYSTPRRCRPQPGVGGTAADTSPRNLCLLACDPLSSAQAYTACEARCSTQPSLDRWCALMPPTKAGCETGAGSSVAHATGCLYLEPQSECEQQGFCQTRDGSTVQAADRHTCLDNGNIYDVGVRVDEYNCTCRVGYAGSECTLDLDECASKPCTNGAHCSDSTTSPQVAPGVFVCACRVGFSGPTCLSDVDECASGPCVNGATCKESTSLDASTLVVPHGRYVCTCVAGFEGTNCAHDTNECMSNPCKHNGTCVESGSNHPELCTSAAGPCAGISLCDGTECAGKCVQPGACGTLDNECAALPGFHECSNTGQCWLQVDSGQRTITNATGKISCERSTGHHWTGACVSGGLVTVRIAAHAEQDWVDCAGRCVRRGECVRPSECIGQCVDSGRCAVIGKGNLVECRGACVPAVDCGINALPLFVERILERGAAEARATSVACHQQCVPVNHSACLCPAGWRGVYCEEEVDECVSYPCHQAALCVDLVNAFRCDCPVGYEGYECNLDTDECASVPCKNGGVCRESILQGTRSPAGSSLGATPDARVPVGAFQCTCTAGWQGLTCEDDIDECLSSPCLYGGTCKNNYGVGGCIECGLGMHDDDGDPATACVACAPGRHSVSGSTACEQCEAGRADIDASATTPCELCAVGQHSTVGALVCTLCSAGQADIDLDSKTPCVVCDRGKYAGVATGTATWPFVQGLRYRNVEIWRAFALWFGVGDTIEILAWRGVKPSTLPWVGGPQEGWALGRRNNTIGYFPAHYVTVTSNSHLGAVACEACVAGKYDHDAMTSSLSSQTACLPCQVGKYSPAGSTTCFQCAGGYNDTDANPATPCNHSGNSCAAGTAVMGTGACMPCRTGMHDHDADPSTACLACVAGSYAPAGASSCITCAVGQHVSSTGCVNCAPGFADMDASPATPCVSCSAGQFSAIATSSCRACAAGTYDHDAGSGTSSSTLCVDCPTGSYAPPGSIMCTACASGYADHDNDPSTSCASNVGVCAAGSFDDPAYYRCSCATGWQGTNCANGIDECLSQPCQNNGVCEDRLSAYFCACPSAWGGINCESRAVNVPGDQPTIQDAINFASDGDVVQVQPGIYTGLGNVHIHLLGKAITVRSVDSLRDMGPDRTIIDCAGASFGFFVNAGESRQTKIIGFTVQHCSWSAFKFSHASPSVHGCVASYNSNNFKGAGFYLLNSDAELHGCVAHNNTAVDGAGLYVYRGTPSIVSTNLTFNTATHYGGGAVLFETAAIMRTSFILHNLAHKDGGGAVVHKGNPSLLSVQVSHNNAQDDGGGLRLWFTIALMEDVLVQANTCTNSGGGLYIYGGAPMLSQCRLRNNNALIDGGAFYWDSTAATGGDLKVEDNVAAGSGGGGLVRFGSALIKSSTFRGNIARTGGALVLDRTDMAVSDTSFRSNSAQDYFAGPGEGGMGAAISIFAGAPKVQSCMFYRNIAAVDGGGMRIHARSEAQVLNSTFESCEGERGGGISVTDANITLRDCLFDRNLARSDGGGVYIGGLAPTFDFVSFVGNMAVHGGGIYATQAGSAIRNCNITDNTAKLGAGVYSITSGLRLTRTRLIRNAAETRGGGLVSVSGHDSMIGIVFLGNTALEGGGAMLDHAASTLFSVTFQQNTAQLGGGLSARHGTAAVESCVFDRNGANLEGGGVLFHNMSGHIHLTHFEHNFAHETMLVYNPLLSAPPQGAGGALSLRSGSTSLVDCVLRDNVAGHAGGGLHAADGCTSLLSNLTLDRNVARFGGGINARSSLLVVNGSHFSRNQADADGGAWCAVEDGSSLGLLLFEANVAQRGGGLFATQSSSQIRDVIVRRNTANQGGGLFLQYSSVQLVQVSILSNLARKTGGGAFGLNGTDSFDDCVVTANKAPRGGGLYLHRAETVLMALHVTNNTARHGGGLYIDSAIVFLRHTHVVDNIGLHHAGGLWARASAVDIYASQLRGNFGGEGGALRVIDQCSLKARQSLLDGNRASVGGGLVAVESSVHFDACDISRNAGGGLILNHSTGVWSLLVMRFNCDFGAVLHESSAKIDRITFVNNTARCHPTVTRGTPKLLQVRAGLATALGIELQTVQILEAHIAGQRGRVTLSYQAEVAFGDQPSSGSLWTDAFRPQPYDMSPAFWQMSTMPTTTLDYGSACSVNGPQLLPDGGQVHFTGGYDNELSCAWLIECSRPQDKVTAQFTAFRTEAGHDRVILYDGSSQTDPLLADLHGETATTYYGKSGRMLLTFVSDDVVPDDGFAVKFTCTDPFLFSGTSDLTSPPTASPEPPTVRDCSERNLSSWAASNYGWNLSTPTEGFQPCNNLAEQLDCAAGALCTHVAPCPFLPRPGQPCPYSNASGSTVGAERALWRHACICPFGYTGTDLFRAVPCMDDTRGALTSSGTTCTQLVTQAANDCSQSAAQVMSTNQLSEAISQLSLAQLCPRTCGNCKHRCTAIPDVLNCTTASPTQSSTFGANAAADTSASDVSDTSWYGSTVGLEFGRNWSAELASWVPVPPPPAPVQSFSELLARSINATGNAIDPTLNATAVLSPAPHLVTMVNLSSPLDDESLSARGVYALSQPTIVRAALIRAGGVVKRMLSSHAAPKTAFGSSGAMVLTLQAEVSFVGHVNEAQLLDAVVFAAAVNRSRVVISAFYQRVLGTLELPGSLQDYDRGRSFTLFATDAHTAKNLSTVRPDILLDNSRMSLLRVPLPEGFHLCSTTRPEHCCGDTKCYGLESPMNCPQDCPNTCWADLIGSGARQAPPHSYGVGICSLHSPQDDTTRCPMDDAACDSARLSTIFKSEVSMVTYSAGGKLERCLGYLDENRNKQLDPGERTAVSDLNGVMVWTEYLGLITHHPMVVPAGSEQLPTCVRAGIRGNLTTVYHRTNGTGNVVSGSINLMTTFQAELVRQGMDQASARACTLQCINGPDITPNFGPRAPDYAMDDPYSWVESSNGLEIDQGIASLKEIAMLHTILIGIASAVPAANATFVMALEAALGAPVDWYAHALSTLANSSARKWLRVRDSTSTDYLLTANPCDYRRMASAADAPFQSQTESEDIAWLEGLIAEAALRASNLVATSQYGPTSSASMPGVTRRRLAEGNEPATTPAIVVEPSLAQRVARTLYDVDVEVNRRHGSAGLVGERKILPVYATTVLAEEQIAPAVRSLVDGSYTISQWLQHVGLASRLRSALVTTEASISGCKDPRALNGKVDLWPVSNPLACKYVGCTNSAADNYNPQAIRDVEGQDSCLFFGCFDDDAENFNQHGYDLARNANFRDDGSCRYRVRGCTDPEALNHYVNATYDDGSCRYYRYGCRDPTATNYRPEYIRDCSDVGRVYGPNGTSWPQLWHTQADGSRVPYSVCEHAASAVKEACCSRCAAPPPDSQLKAQAADGSCQVGILQGNTSLCEFPPPPDPPWWEQLDYRWFLWGAVGVAALFMARQCWSLCRKGKYIAPPPAEVSPLAGKFLVCARCDSRLAVNVYTSPAGQIEPLCFACFERRTRDSALAWRLLKQTSGFSEQSIRAKHEAEQADDSSRSARAKSAERRQRRQTPPLHKMRGGKVDFDGLDSDNSSTAASSQTESEEERPPPRARRQRRLSVFD
jgi:hypothetical protein